MESIKDIDLIEIYNEELINKFKNEDYSNYMMYKNSGLSDDDIINLLENSLKDLYNFY